MPRIGTVIREVYRRPGADALPGHLADRYGIRIIATTRLDGGVFRVDHEDRPPWVARIHVSSRPVDRTEADAEVLRFLERHEFPAERCAHPEPVSVLGDQHGQAVLVTEFVPGPRPPGSPATRRALGRLLGRLCVLPTEPGATQRPAGSLHHLPDYEGAPGRDLAAAAALLADLDGRVPARYRQVYDGLRELLPLGDDAAGLPEAFIHPDLARSNVIAGPGGPVLVDWTGAGRGPRLAALAVLLNSMAPQHAAEVLAGFRAHAGDLTAEELDRLEGVLWIRPLWLASWQCWLAAVSAKASRAFLPDREHITAMAAAVRAAQPVLS